MPRVVRLSAAQRSALECAGLDLDGESPALLAAWDGAAALRFESADVDRVCWELHMAANAEDGVPEIDAAGRGARDALANLARKIRDGA